MSLNKMSLRINPDWVYKLKPFKPEATLEEKTNVINAINQFRRAEIFEHSYDENAIFHHIYKESSPAKRQPNPFMVFRMILGLIAVRNKIKIGDGTLQSKVAGYMWGGASKEEKASFNNISQKFKDLHKEKFPNYEYKPRQRTSPVTGTFAEPITRSHYENYETEEDVVSNQQILQESLISKQTPEDSNMYTDITTIDTSFMLNGAFPQQPIYQIQQQPQFFPYSFLNQNQVNQILGPQEFNLAEHQMNVLDTMNTLEKFEYSQSTPANTLGEFPQSTPTIALNCLDLNQPINFNNPPYYDNNNNYYY